VSDNGVGLPKGVDPTTAETMGLRLVRLWACHQLGGELTVERAGGTTLRVRFRRRAAADGGGAA
jgi:two-component sensor histidine kinase